jgi:hypothetical protein
LLVGKSLGVGGMLVSANGRYAATLKSGGRLVVEQITAPAHLTWMTNTAGGSPSRLTLQTDGDLELLTAGGKILWLSWTVGMPATKLVMQNDGNLVLDGPTGATWSWVTGRLNGMAACPSNLADNLGSGIGGTQLLIELSPSAPSQSGILQAWSRKPEGCWGLASIPGAPAEPYSAELGYAGSLQLAYRVPDDNTTPIGIFSLGSTIYGNATRSPSSLYPYHHLVCGDWWDETPGDGLYETFQHVTCWVTPPWSWDSEALWTESEPYQHFIDIEMPHPPDNASGIFLHDDTTTGYTAGCVALPNGELDAVLGWLNPADSPHMVILVEF